MPCSPLSSAKRDSDATVPETEAASRMVAENPKLTIVKAKEGSLEHLRAIGSSIQHQTFPEDLLPDALEMFCHHFSSEITMKADDTTIVVLESLIPLATTTEAFDTDSQADSHGALVSIIAKYLPRILDW